MIKLLKNFTKRDWVLAFISFGLITGFFLFDFNLPYILTNISDSKNSL